MVIAMGFFDEVGDFFFGESPKARVTNKSLLSGSQSGLLDNLIAMLSQQRPSQFQGQLSAPLGQGERMSLAALEERSKALALPQQADASLQKLTDFEGQTADASKFFETNVQQPLLESFGREVLPAISRQFGGANFFSSERQATEGLARQDLLESLTAGKSAVELDQFNQSRNRAIQAAQVLGDRESQLSSTLIDILEAQGVPREVAQQNIDRKYQEFVRQQGEEEFIKKLLALLATTPTTENVATVTPGSPGVVQSAISAFFGGL